ncbi:MAG: hypothetical protein ACR2IE_03530 [Candidatus Sumerlaeaceae bacterium]
MGQSDNSTDLIDLARNLDLYARRHRIIFALDVGQLETALQLCRGAMADCEGDLSEICSPAERAQHEQKLAHLKQFESRLSSAARSGACESHNWVAA